MRQISNNLRKKGQPFYIVLGVRFKRSTTTYQEHMQNQRTMLVMR
nr:unnamed protein product [Callosobruchus analis]CAI5846930.1 unnamed protein product [Callosobruchus analis]